MLLAFTTLALPTALGSLALAALAFTTALTTAFTTALATALAAAAASLAGARAVALGRWAGLEVFAVVHDEDALALVGGLGHGQGGLGGLGRRAAGLFRGGGRGRFRVGR